MDGHSHTVKFQSVKSSRLRRLAPRAFPSRPNSRVQHSWALHRCPSAGNNRVHEEVQMRAKKGAQCQTGTSSSRRAPTPRPSPNSTPTPTPTRVEGAVRAGEGRLAERIRVWVDSGGCRYLLPGARDCLTFPQLDFFDKSPGGTSSLHSNNYAQTL